MTPREKLVARIAAWTGLDLARGGRGDALDRVIAQRTRALGHASPEAYVASLASESAPEVRALIDALTVGHTWFFRDDEQNAVFVDVMRASRANPLHVWIAGTSTGEEAYTLALLAASAKRRVSILGTDINARSLETAAAGEYGAWSLRNVPSDVRATFVKSGERWAVPPAIRALVRFERHNLLDPPKTRSGGFDLILCRNVLIYFDREAASRTLARLASCLSADGWLFLGASEVLSAAPAGFVVASVGGRYGIRPTRRDDAPVAAAAQLRVVAKEQESANAPELLERALACVERGAAQEAMTLALRALAIDPLSADARLVAGIGLYTSGDAARAMEELRAALFLEPEQWVASFYLARTYEKLGRAADAKLEYQKVVARPAPPARLATLRAWETEMLAIARMRA